MKVMRVGVAVFVLVIMCMGVSMGVRRVVRMTMGGRGEAHRDRDDSLIGYAATLPFSEHGQSLQNASKQGMCDRAGDGRHRGRPGA